MGFAVRSTERNASVCFMMAQLFGFMVVTWWGGELLTKITSSCEGFRFLGIILVVFGCLFLLMLCFSCVTFDAVPELSLGKDLLCYVPMYLTMAGLAIFALAVSSSGGGKSPSGRSYKEYSLPSYSKWMQNKVNDTHMWDTYYKTSLVKNDVCSKFTKEYAQDTLDEFYKRDLSPLESGCCMPREECNFDYTSPSIWTKLENQSYSNKDCKAWDNDLNIRCYECQSCKASFVQDLTTEWFWKGIYLVGLLTFQILMLIVFIWPTDSSGCYVSLLN